MFDSGATLCSSLCIKIGGVLTAIDPDCNLQDHTHRPSLLRWCLNAKEKKIPWKMKRKSGLNIKSMSGVCKHLLPVFCLCFISVFQITLLCFSVFIMRSHGDADTSLVLQEELLFFSLFTHFSSTWSLLHLHLLSTKASQVEILVFLKFWQFSFFFFSHHRINNSLLTITVLTTDFFPYWTQQEAGSVFMAAARKLHE